MKYIRIMLFFVAAIGVSGFFLQAFNPVWWQNVKLELYPKAAKVMALGGQEIEEVSGGSTGRVSQDLLLPGGPPKDGIPSLDAPSFVPLDQTSFAKDSLGLGVVINGEARFYPYLVLNWHEIVNDRIGGVDVAVTYCPLCETGIVFHRKKTTFGVTGRLFQSCLVMYARADDTWYVQPWGMGIKGPGIHDSLKRYPAVRTTLRRWAAKNPQTRVLTKDTGFPRDYERYPYGSYYTDEKIVFPVRGQGELRDHPKALYQYYWEADGGHPRNRFSGEFYKVSFETMKEVKQVQLAENVQARWDEDYQAVVFFDDGGGVLPSSTAFAFVLEALF